jgi:hypothetical protein
MLPVITAAARPSVLTEAGTWVASVGDGLVDPCDRVLAGVADFAHDTGQRLRTTRRCHPVGIITPSHLPLLWSATASGSSDGRGPRAGTWSRGDHYG